MAQKPLFLFIGQYDDATLAKADLDVIHGLHSAKIIGTYDAAIIVKEADGSVKVHKHEKPTQHGFWTGAVAGAVAGILFPPSLLGTALVGGATGALIGHLWHGMSRRDMHELGEMLDTGQALLVVAGADKLTPQLDKAELKALKRVETSLYVDEKALEVQFEEAKRELAAS